jgi:hypothetical protein
MCFLPLHPARTHMDPLDSLYNLCVIPGIRCSAILQCPPEANSRDGAFPEDRSYLSSGQMGLSAWRPWFEVTDLVDFEEQSRPVAEV